MSLKVSDSKGCGALPWLWRSRTGPQAAPGLFQGQEELLWLQAGTGLSWDPATQTGSPRRTLSTL